MWDTPPVIPQSYAYQGMCLLRNRLLLQAMVRGSLLSQAGYLRIQCALQSLYRLGIFLWSFLRMDDLWAGEHPTMVTGDRPDTGMATTMVTVMVTITDIVQDIGPDIMQAAGMPITGPLPMTTDLWPPNNVYNNRAQGSEKLRRHMCTIPRRATGWPTDRSCQTRGTTCQQAQQCLYRPERECISEGRR